VQQLRAERTAAHRKVGPPAGVSARTDLRSPYPTVTVATASDAADEGWDVDTELDAFADDTFGVRAPHGGFMQGCDSHAAKVAWGQYVGVPERPFGRLPLPLPALPA